MVDTCAISGFDGIMENTIMPLSAMATIASALICGFTYMISQVITNPKLSLWAKTEAVQLIFSAGSVFLLIMLMNTFCTMKVSEVASLFGKSSDSISVYDAAAKYLADAGYYSIRALTVVRFHLEAYSVLGALSVFECEFAGGIGCLFGYSGTNIQALGGYGAHQAALGIFFNSTIMSVISALNFLFILQYVYRGFVVMFLPLGIFMRSMPYMRTFGALLISVSISFLTVYPFLLSVFYIMEDAILDKPAYEPGSFGDYYDETIYSEGGAGESLEAAVAGTDAVYENYFPNGDNAAGAMMFAVYAFIAAVFLPTAALLGTIGTIAYLTRMYGEEIDLSRILQMV
jgi:hypothetical protein